MKKHFVFILALCNWAYAQEGGHARSYSPNVPIVSNAPLLKQVLAKGTGNLKRWHSDESNLATAGKEALTEEAPPAPINSPIRENRILIDYSSKLTANRLTSALVRLTQKYAPSICPS